jgi:hypothetical protein
MDAPEQERDRTGEVDEGEGGIQRDGNSDLPAGGIPRLGRWA